MYNDEALAALVKSRPVSRVSYSASLLVIGNWKGTAHSIISPSRDCRTTSIPLTCRLDNPSVQTIHGAIP